MHYLYSRYEHAKSPIKKRQAHRDWLCTLIGVNSAFRAEDLLQIKVKDVAKGYFLIRERKTGKVQNYRINNWLYDDIKKYIEMYGLKPNDYLFTTQKKGWLTPITRQQFDRILKAAANAIQLRQNFSAHSLRKTWAYQKYIDGTPLLTISKMLNHYDIQETLIYICWGEEDIDREREATYYGGIHAHEKNKRRKNRIIF